MEPEWQSPEISREIAAFFTDAELALALHEEEVAQLSCLSLQQSRPATPSTHGADAYGDPTEAGTIKECQVCCEEKHTDLYPQTTTANDCRCLSDVCIVCIQQHIKSQTESKEWKDGALTCPMCNRPLVPQEIEEYADGDTLKTHLSHMIDQTVNDMPNFARCPNPDCNSGQVHEGGESHPFVTCAACNTQFCFRHGIPTQPLQHQQQSPSSSSQHENMSCDEYDRYLADPMSFRSEHQRQQERTVVERRELEAVARARERMDKILEQRRATAAAADESRRKEEEKKNAAREERERKALERRERKEKEEEKKNAAREERERRELERRERKEREEREERARVEQRLYEEEQARAEAERRARAAEVLRRKEEDEQSEWLIGETTKGCPRCAKRIEKNEGW